jgi:hypothetical protein
MVLYLFLQIALCQLKTQPPGLQQITNVVASIPYQFAFEDDLLWLSHPLLVQLHGLSLINDMRLPSGHALVMILPSVHRKELQTTSIIQVHTLVPHLEIFNNFVV